MSRFRFTFVILWFTAVLIFSVYLRGAENRVFYKLCKITAEQNRLKQQLANKQLRLENMINPSAVSEKLRK